MTDRKIRPLEFAENMTIREDFAKAAMQGIWANGQIVSKHHDFPDVETIAKWSVDSADALIAALNEIQPS